MNRGQGEVGTCLLLWALLGGCVTPDAPPPQDPARAAGPQRGFAAGAGATPEQQGTAGPAPTQPAPTAALVNSEQTPPVAAATAQQVPAPALAPGDPAGPQGGPPAGGAQLAVSLPLAPGRCAASACTCRDPAAAQARPEPGVAAGRRRVELRLPGGDARIRLTVAGLGEVAKPADYTAASCLYVDLPPGAYAVTLHSARRPGALALRTGLEVFEEDGQGSWHPTFHFGCGLPAGACTAQQMAAFKGSRLGLSEGRLDRTIPTRVRAVTWTGQRPPGGDPRYLSLTLRLTLERF